MQVCEVKHTHYNREVTTYRQIGVIKLLGQFQLLFAIRKSSLKTAV